MYRCEEFAQNVQTPFKYAKREGELAHRATLPFVYLPIIWMQMTKDIRDPK